MNLFAKCSFLRLVLMGISLLLLASVIFNFFGYKSEAIIFLRISKGVARVPHPPRLPPPPPAVRLTVSQMDHDKQQSSPALPLCPYPDLRSGGGPFQPNKTFVSLIEVERELRGTLKIGGTFEPQHCSPRFHVAIVVPFRDRYSHLSIFLHNIHPFLQRQGIAYRIFVVEQTNGAGFNHGALTNIGFLEALKVYRWDCFVFHDADLLPMDNRNLYNCPRQPRHMSVAIDKFQFNLPYQSLVGGVSAMTREHVQTVNGFSNLYYGWGGEDDDMYKRLKKAGLFISRYPKHIARYTMLKHKKEKPNFQK